MFKPTPDFHDRWQICVGGAPAPFYNGLMKVLFELIPVRTEDSEVQVAAGGVKVMHRLRHRLKIQLIRAYADELPKLVQLAVKVV